MFYYPFPAVRWNILAMSSYINWEISDNVLFVRKFFGTKPGHHVVTSFTKPGPAILTWPISFAPCLLISIIKSTKWWFLSSIHQSFHSMRAIQRETERNSGLGSSWSSFCGTLSLISQLIYDDIAKMFHLTVRNG